MFGSSTIRSGTFNKVELVLHKLLPAKHEYVPLIIPAMRGFMGKDGMHGIQGMQGIQGLLGEQGHRGRDGKDGSSGIDGLRGARGPIGRGIQAFKFGLGMRWIELFYTDGTSETVKAIAPAGTENDPLWLMGGNPAGVTVKDIIGGDGIIVEVNQGIYTISQDEVVAESLNIIQTSDSVYEVQTTDDIIITRGNVNIELFNVDDAFDKTLGIKCRAGKNETIALDPDTIDDSTDNPKLEKDGQLNLTPDVPENWSRS